MAYYLNANDCKTMHPVLLNLPVWIDYSSIKVYETVSLEQYHQQCHQQCHLLHDIADDFMKYVSNLVNKVYEQIEMDEVGVIIIRCHCVSNCGGHRALYVSKQSTEGLSKYFITSKNFSLYFLQ